MPDPSFSAPPEPVGLPVRVEWLQRADRLVFAAGCLLMTLLRRILPEPDSTKPPAPKSLLFVKLAEQGSTVLAARAIRRAGELVGRENVYFIVFAENRFILDVMNLIPGQNVFPVPTRSLWSMASGVLSALRKIRRQRIDAAVDLEFFARFSAVITWLSGARWRAGLHPYFNEGPYRGDLFTHRILYNPHIHTSEMFLSLVEALTRPSAGLPTLPFQIRSSSEPDPVFVAAPAEVGSVRALLAEKLGPASAAPLIVLNANASDLLPLRRWPIERYAGLARRLLEKFPEICVVFTGLKNEAAATEALAREVNSTRCCSLGGRTTLRELLVLYTLSEVLVTNDSGPAHFATLTPVNVVTLFGPETPELFAARTPRNTVLFSGLACSPCVNALNNRQTACRDNQCMKSITVDEVFEATAEVYSRRRASAGATPALIAR